MLRKKELFLLLDADDCIYNNTYRYLILSIIKTFGDEISSISTADAEKLVSKVMEYIKKIVLEKVVVTNEFLDKFELSFLEQHDSEIFDAYSVHLKQADQAKSSAGSKTQDSMENLVSKYISSVSCEYLSYVDELGEPGKELIKHILLAANIELFNYFMSRIENESFDHVTIMSVSNRGVDFDQHNAQVNGTGLFNIDIQYLCELFNEILKERGLKKVKCSYNDFTMSNVYNGTMSVWDETKFSLYLSAAHEIGVLNPNPENVIAIFDDRLDILGASAQKFASDLSILPSCKYEFWKYTGRIFTSRKYVKLSEITSQESVSSVIGSGNVLILQGKGIAHNNYAAVIKELVKHCVGKANKTGDHQKNTIEVNFAASLSLDEINQIFRKVSPLLKLSPSQLEMGHSDSDNDSDLSAKEQDDAESSDNLEGSVQTVHILESSSRSGGAANKDGISRDSSASSALNSATPPKSDPREIPIRKSLNHLNNPDPSPQRSPSAAAAAAPRHSNDLVADPSPLQKRKSDARQQKVTVVQSATLFGGTPHTGSPPKSVKKRRGCTVM